MRKLLRLAPLALLALPIVAAPASADEVTTIRRSSDGPSARRVVKRVETDGMGSRRVTKKVTRTNAYGDRVTKKVTRTSDD